MGFFATAASNGNKSSLPHSQEHPGTQTEDTRGHHVDLRTNTARGLLLVKALQGADLSRCADAQNESPSIVVGGERRGVPGSYGMATTGVERVQLVGEKKQHGEGESTWAGQECAEGVLEGQNRGHELSHKGHMLHYRGMECEGGE